MILNTNGAPNTQVYGNLSQNRVSIDVKNLDFITQILSSNLYSEPLDSFLREIVSNASDSHKEAGTTDPIILDIGTVNSKLYIRIQDFGTGISPERFDMIYRFIGSSTKRETNEYIGSFGLGRMSVLAVGDAATITNRYDGTEYKYLMYKDGMAINIDEISTLKTNERNGLEVYVEPTIDCSYSDILRAIKKLIFFDNLYINLNIKEQNSYSYYSSSLSELKRFVTDFNEKDNLTFNNFKVSDKLNRYSFVVLLGDVLYEVNSSHSYGYESSWQDDGCYNRCVCPSFNIGELSVTPNRESLLYDSKTEEALKKKFEAVDKEIASLFKDEFYGDKDFKIAGKIYNGFDAKFSDNSHASIFFSGETYRKNLAENATVYGYSLNESELNALTRLCRSFCPFHSQHRYNGRILKSKDVDVSLIDFVYNKISYSATEFFRKGFRTFNMYLKSWMKEEYSYFSILERYGIRESIKNFAKYNDTNNITRNVKKVYFKMVADAWNSIPEITESIITDEYKSKFKVERVSNENINVYYYDTSGYAALRKCTLDYLVNKGDSYLIYFTEIENTIPTALARVDRDLFRYDEEFSDTALSIEFIQVSDKVSKVLAGVPNAYHYTVLLDPNKYWISFVKTWEQIKLKPWHDTLMRANSYSGFLNDDMKHLASMFSDERATYHSTGRCRDYIQPFYKDAEIDNDLIEKLTPSDEYINTYNALAKLNSYGYSDLINILLSTIPGTVENVDGKNKLEELKNLFENVEEHN